MTARGFLESITAVLLLEGRLDETHLREGDQRTRHQRSEVSLPAVEPVRLSMCCLALKVLAQIYKSVSQRSDKLCVKLILAQKLHLKIEREKRGASDCET